MGTLPYVLAPSRAATLLMVAAVAAACGTSTPNNVASHSHSPAASASPSASPYSQPASSPSPPTITGAYGVLYGSQAASTYRVNIIGVDGKVVASAQVSTPPLPSCANSAAAVVSPPVSTTNTRVYFEDAQGTIHYLGPNGDTGTATTAPAPTGSRRAMFAVSPDDARIAVVVDDFNSSGASTRLYVENLSGGGDHLDLFTQTGAFSLWPVGWHGTNNLVLAKVPSCRQGVGVGGNSIIEYHVVDPATATRRFTIGGTNCGLSLSDPSPAGVVCENPPNAIILSWTDTALRTYAIQGPIGAYLSPNGSNVAFVDNIGTTFTNGGSAMSGVFACVWIDDGHVLAGGDFQHQARIGSISDASIVPVPAQGDCGGRLPGGL